MNDRMSVHCSKEQLRMLQELCRENGRMSQRAYLDRLIAVDYRKYKAKQGTTDGNSK